MKLLNNFALRKISIFFSVAFVFFILQKSANGATCTSCPSGWYSCQNGAKCCTGGGCPSNICGTCSASTGWQCTSDGAASICPEGAGRTCAGCCMSCGGSLPLAPTHKDMPGWVWSDTNNNGYLNWGDKMWYAPGYPYTFTAGCASGTCNCATGTNWFTASLPEYPRQADPGLQVTSVAPLASMEYSLWQCNGGDGTMSIGTIQIFSHVVTYFLKNNWSDRPYTYVLTPPAGVDCSQVRWDHLYCAARGCDTSGDPYHEFGTSCVAIFQPNRYRNQLNWQIPDPGASTPRAINGQIFVTNNPGSCSNDGAVNLTGLTAKAYDSTGLQIGTTATLSSGAYAITGLLSTDSFASLGIIGSLSNITETYKPACVRSTNATCSLGSGAIANCSSTNLSAGDATINMGFTKGSNPKWFSVLDGDLYAESVTTAVSQAPTGGFTSNLINTLTGTSIGGYGFAGLTINTTNTGTGVTEKGGRAENITTSPTHTFQDNWLNNFSFVPPASAVATIPGSNNFQEGKVYTMSTADFQNDVLASNTYKIVAANEAQKATAIIYVTGGGTITFNQPFTTDQPATQILTVVTDASVEVADNVTVPDILTYSINSPAQIQLNIISAGDITSKSKYSVSTNTTDLPLVVNGTLMAKGTVNLNKNLGSGNNGILPAELINFYPYLGYLLEQYEINHPDEHPYTGLTTNDVQFDYAN